MLIVFTYLDVTRNRYDKNEIPSKLFMGFGYNPDLVNFGERLDIINFYWWMKQLREKFSTDWFIYDASGYFIVNRTPQKKIRKLGNRPTAEQILDTLVTEQDRPKRQEIIRNCELRSKYLQRAIAISDIPARYIDSRKVFREDSDYRAALDVSLEFVKKLKNDNPELVEKTLPSNPNPASRLYLPLEIAEALYLESKFGIDGKFGPKTEESFDQTILVLTEKQKIPYQTIRCSFGPRKPGYLTDKGVIWTISSDYFVSSILQSDKEYREFVGQYLEPFRKNGEKIEDAVLRMKKELTLEEVF